MSDLVPNEVLADIAAMMGKHVDNWPAPKKISTAIALIDKTLAAALSEREGEPVTCPRATRLHGPLRYCPDCPGEAACELPDEARHHNHSRPGEDDVETVARALAAHDGIEICSDASYRHSSYGAKARAAIAALSRTYSQGIEDG